ncbi:MAG: DNA polymerase III subunit alpha [Porphyromonas sp.]|nr:DNA polymerase III subunit alpha [Porphyromonas sp.]
MSELYPFVHLHVHSHYSVLDGLATIPELVDRAIADKMPGIALTDHGTMFGIKDFVNYINKHNAPYNKVISSATLNLQGATSDEERAKFESEISAAQKNKIKPIIGCECYCAVRGRHKKEGSLDRSGYHLILLAKNLVGYKNLIKLASISYSEGLYYRPRIDKELLEQYHEGLIVTSACLGGEIPQLIRQNRMAEAEQSILWFKKVFGDDYYLELQRHKTNKPRANYETFEIQKTVNESLIELARKTGVKLIATNDVHFAAEEDGEAHDRLICLSTNRDFNDPNRMVYTKQEWLKSIAEMNDIFQDIPEALTNTIEILDKIEEFSIDHKPLMPDFPIPDGFKDEDDYLRHLSYEGAKERYGDPLSEEIIERLDYELGVMKSMGYPGYFLIVQDLIAQARRLGVSVGPGRGSAAGSLVAYALKITDIDPLRYGLLFERFLNPDRVSLPDIDMDFDDDGRQEILNWVTDHYGKDRVAHIVTYGTMATKSSIKDVARILNLPLSESNALTNVIPDRIEGVKNITVKAAVEHVPELREIYYGEESLKKEVLKYAMSLEGTIRNLGVHACGIIIGKVPISDIVPTWVSKDSDTGEDLLITQYEGSVIEDTGLIKMDFLGLKTLSIIRAALENIKERHGIDIDVDHLPMDDEETFQLFREGNTHAVFQFESPGMQKSLRLLGPTQFEDLIAMVALYRPGPMDNIPTYAARKSGDESIRYDLPVMEEFLKETYGVTVYQEQVMLLSRKIANFTRGESDTLRKAMGKKREQEMAMLKGKFLSGGEANGHPKEVLEKIWSDWLKFASYAFNKSHAACYAWIAYQTAYLKAHYPAEFMAGVLSRNIDKIAEITKYMEESRKMGISVLSPDVNESDFQFSVNKEGNIRFGLGAIKGFGRAAANSIVQERRANGPYKDVYDFFERVNDSTLSYKTCEALILSGAFDSFSDYKREDFLIKESPSSDDNFLSRLLKYGQQFQIGKDSAQVSLFGDSEFQEMAKPVLVVTGETWNNIELLNKEKELLGVYLTATPLDKYELVLNYKCNFKCSDLSDLSEFAGEELILGGMVTGYRESTTKRGDPCGFIKIQDFEGEGEIALFKDQYLNFSKFGKVGLFLYINALAEQSYNGKVYLKVNSIQLLDNIYQSLFTKLHIRLPMWVLTEEFYDELIPALRESGDGGVVEVEIEVSDSINRVYLTLNSEEINKIALTPKILEMLKTYEDHGVEFELN